MNDSLLDGAGGRPEVAPGEAQAKLDQKIAALRRQDEEREVQARAAALGLPYINLQGFPLNADSLSVVPEADARRLQLVCFWLSIGDLRLAAVDPHAAGVPAYAAALGQRHFVTPTISLTSAASLAAALRAYVRVPKHLPVSAGVAITEDELNRFSGRVGSLRELGASLERVTTTEAVTAIIAGGLKSRASDIHLEAEEDGAQLRYRIDGVLYPVATLPRATAAKAIPRLKLLSGLKINVTDRPQDGRFTIHLAADKIDVRVSTLPTAHGESTVLRLLRWSAAGISFEKLGLIGRALERLSAELEKPNGMIISTGPTGSGKTTTLYAIISKLNDSETKIITLEDPIEYKLPGVNQSQVDAGQGYTFANGLRSILRQDPDIVMVGEIRDLETADIAANAALTGHLVLSTLHTNNAAGAIPRLLGMGLKPFLLPPALNAVLGQRLVRRLCEACREADAPDAKTLARVREQLAALPAGEQPDVPKELKFQKGRGCDECQGLGYRGQLGLFEVLVMNKDIEAAILEERVSESKIEALVRADGMVTMMQDGLLKALRGLTSLDEVFRVTRE